MVIYLIPKKIQKLGKVPSALNCIFFIGLLDKLMDVEHGINNILAQYIHDEKELTKTNTYMIIGKTMAIIWACWCITLL